MQHFKAMLISYLILLALLLSSTIPAIASHSPSETIKIQLKWKHQFQFAGFYMALEKGIYRDAGLNVQLIEGHADKSPVDSIIRAGAQYAVSDTGAMIYNAKGLPVQVVAAIFQHSPLILVSRQSLDISNPIHIKQQRIMLQPGYQMAEAVAALKKAGISNSDFIRQASTYQINDLIQGKTDIFSAYSTNEPYYLRQQGWPYHLFRPIDYGIDFYGDILITHSDEIRQHPDRVEAVRKASIAGWKYALEHIDETIAVIQKKYNTQHKSREHLLFEANAIADIMMPKFINIGYMSMQRWQAIADVYQQQGLLDKTFKPQSFVYQAKPNIIDTLKQHPQSVLLFFFGMIILFTVLHLLHLKRAIRRRTHELKESNQQLNQEIEIRLNTEKDLQKAIIKAEKANIAKSEFLAVMSHELRTPIHGLIGCLDLLKLKTLNPDAHSYIEQASKASHSLHILLNDILDLSKIEAGAMQLHIAPFSIVDCIQDSVSPLLTVAQQKNLTISCQSKQTPCTMHGDISRMRQILLNLIGNAVKFTEKGFVRIEISYSGALLTCTVHDSGIGISEQDQEHIFEPFTQSKALMERQHSGTGLGTSIVKRFIELMHGTISVESKLGEGSRFTFTIPCHMQGSILPHHIQLQEPLESSPTTTKTLLSNAPTTQRILLAEDDAISRKIASKRLEQADFSVDIAHDGLQAWSNFQQAWQQNTPYDFVLLDIRMPGMDGIAVTQKIRELEMQNAVINTPILGLSAHATEEVRQQCLNAGMNDFLIKPVEPNTIIQTINNLMQDKTLAA